MRRVLEEAMRRVRAGEVLRMQVTEEGTSWWMESPRLDISRVDGATVVAAAGLIEDNDSLFGIEGNSQTWRLPEKPRRARRFRTRQGGRRAPSSS